jgi:N-acetylglucosaminyl-diphospho-decaprenol L-rhamnosyltransferase
MHSCKEPASKQMIVSKDRHRETMETLVDVVVVTYNSQETILPCLDSLSVQEGVNPSVIVVDNASRDATPSILSRTAASSVLLLDENLGYGQACNLGAQGGAGRYLLVSNADIVYDVHCLARLVTSLEINPSAGACVATLEYPDGRRQESTPILPSLSLLVKVVTGAFTVSRLLAGQPDSLGPVAQPVPDNRYLDGAAVLLRRTAFTSVEGFDPTFFFYGEDVDLSRRLRARGWLLLHDPLASATHVRGASSTRDGRVDASALARLYADSQVLNLPLRSQAYCRSFCALQVIRSLELMVSSQLRRSTVDRKRQNRLQEAGLREWLARLWAGPGNNSRPHNESRRNKTTGSIAPCPEAPRDVRV